MIELPQLDKQKTNLLAQVEAWSPTRLAFRPNPAEWSAAQVFDHLVRSETEILHVTRRTLATPHRLGIRDKLGYLFVKRIFETRRKVKAPASVAGIIPQPDPDLAEILARWNAARLDLAHFIPELTPAQRQTGIFRHPVTGWMDLPRILGFFSVHITHHRFQIDRLAAASQHLET